MARKVMAALLATLGLIAAAPALAQGNAAPTPYTASGQAYAEVTQAVRSDGLMTMVVRFKTDEPDYAGETLYEPMDQSEILRRVYLDAADRTFLLIWDDGVPQMPERFELEANSTGEPGAVVGEWQGLFEAPDHDLSRITLILPSVGRIGPVPIRNR